MVSHPGERANGVYVTKVASVLLSRKTRAILASAYEVEQARVEQDVRMVRNWAGTEAELLAVLQERHNWTAASEYAPHYVGDLRAVLEAAT
jgi:hypothetical protein